MSQHNDIHLAVKIITGLWQESLLSRQDAGRRIRKHRAVCSPSRPRNDERKAKRRDFGRRKRDRETETTGTNTRSSNKPPIANDDHARRKRPTMTDDRESSASPGLLTKEKKVGRRERKHCGLPPSDDEL